MRYAPNVRPGATPAASARGAGVGLPPVIVVASWASRFVAMSRAQTLQK